VLDGLRRAGDENGPGPDSAGALERAVHERRHTAGCQADDDIDGLDLFLIYGLCTVLGIILGALGRAHECAAPPCYYALDHRRRDAESGRTFRCVQNTQPAARAGADVEQPPAPAKPFDNQVNRRGNAPALPGHRSRNQRILGVDQLDDLLR